MSAFNTHSSGTLPPMLQVRHPKEFAGRLKRDIAKRPRLNKFSGVPMGNTAHALLAAPHHGPAPRSGCESVIPGHGPKAVLERKSAAVTPPLSEVLSDTGTAVAP